MSKLSRFWRKHLEQTWVRGSAPVSLNTWQQAFIKWNAEQRGISVSESSAHYEQSCAALRGGHAGRHFKVYCELYYDLCRPFIGRGAGEIQQAYVLHAPLHFLRMLSYAVPSWPAFQPTLVERCRARSPVIVDFGCGLAQISITLALHCRDQGGSPQLFLADLPTPQLDFLRWYCLRLQLPATFAPCAADGPLPEFPAADVCIANEVFEHVHDPMRPLLALQQAARPGGLLLTNLADHSEEFLHVSPRLSPLRERLLEEGWRELQEHRLFEKASAS